MPTTTVRNLQIRESTILEGRLDAVNSAQDGYALIYDNDSGKFKWHAYQESEVYANEVPSGSIDGSNTTFTLANTPIDGKIQLFMNGILLQPGAGNDYTISGDTITMAYAPTTSPGGADKLLAWYMKVSGVVLGGTGTAAGNEGELQYNSSGTFGASTNLLWSSDRLAVARTSAFETLDVGGGLRLGAAENTNAGTIQWDGSNLQIYKSGWVNIDTTIAGSDKQVQFNDSGSMGASANFVWDDSNNRLGINETPSYSLHVDGTFRIGSSTGTNISSLQTTITDLDTALPTSGAVIDYVAATSGAAAGNAGEIQFKAPSGGLLDADSNLYWDDTNKRLGVGRATSPVESLDISGGLRIGNAVASNAGTFKYDATQFWAHNGNWENITWKYTTKTSGPYTASAGEMVFASTAGGVWTLTLPVTPNVGDQVGIADASGDFTSNSLTVGRNGSKIKGVEDDLEINENVSVIMKYSGATYGWVIL